MAELSGVKQRELIELVQQHFPDMGEVEIRNMLNEAQREICEETGIIKGYFTIETVADQRFYDLDDSIFRIKRVELADEDGNLFKIPRLTNIPGTEE